MPIAIDASALHPSTRLSLSALEWLETRISPENILDMGCGNGILSLTSAHTWDASMLSCDISENAIRDISENIRKFAPDAPITPLRSDGFRHPMIAKTGPYGLIIANLLAQWQVQMATEISQNLAPGGTLLLSGILLWQEDGVIEAFQTIGIEVIHRLNELEWVCLIAARKLS